MQVLMFSLNGECYGLDTGRIRRVLPLLELKRLAMAPRYVAGLMNYHGASVPVIDLSLMCGGPGCQARFDTRIILVDYPAPDGAMHALGLIAERVNGVRTIDAFSDSGVATPEAPFLEQVAVQPDCMLQMIGLEQLLPQEVRAILFQPTAEAAPC